MSQNSYALSWHGGAECLNLQTLKLAACLRGSWGRTLPREPGTHWPGPVGVVIQMGLFGCCKAQYGSRHKGWEPPVLPAFLSLLLLLTYRQHDGGGGIRQIWKQMGGEREKIKKEKLKKRDLWKNNNTQSCSSNMFVDLLGLDPYLLPC